MTEAEYLAYDLAHEGKHEFVNGQVLAMSGVSAVHDALQVNLMGALLGRLRGGPCRPHGSDLRVHIDETGMYAYPGLTVVCGQPEYSSTRPPSLLNPGVVIEVLSETTEDYEMNAKAAHYRRRSSVQQILLVDSRRRMVQSQVRNPEGTWTLAEYEAGEVPVAPLGLTIPMDEIYEGVTLELA
jgi:Uma2 family endonuclease